MISIKKTTTLWTIIVALALINLATLVSLWISQPAIGHPERSRPPRQEFFIEQKLNFTDEQTASYRQMRQEYFDRARVYYDEIKEQKVLLYQHLRERNGSNVREIVDRIGQLQAEVELLTFEHFKEVRDLSTIEQQLELDSLMERTVDRAMRPFPRGENFKDRDFRNRH